MAEKLYNDEASAYVGVAASTWRAYRAPRDGKRARTPEPDGTDIEGGHARPYWYVETLDAWKASRPGRGVGGGRKPSGRAE